MFMILLFFKVNVNFNNKYHLYYSQLISNSFYLSFAGLLDVRTRLNDKRV